MMSIEEDEHSTEEELLGTPTETRGVGGGGRACLTYEPRILS
jgi:hypothetical protein